MGIWFFFDILHQKYTIQSRYALRLLCTRLGASGHFKLYVVAVERLNTLFKIFCAYKIQSKVYI